MLRSCRLAWVRLRNNRSSFRPPASLTTKMSTKPDITNEQPIHWILDWDGTITRHDTLDALVGIAASNKPGQPVLANWKRVSQAYLDDYTESIAKLTHHGLYPSQVEEEKNLLLQLKDVEHKSLDRVSKSGIFAGLTGKQLDEGAKQAIESQKVQLREGYEAFFSFIQNRQRQNGDRSSILSVNWSQRFIAASLEAANVGVDIKSILSNELGEITSDMPSDGTIGAAVKHPIIASADKLQELQALRHRNEATGDPAFTVYVGDSWTDLECLLEADLGICMRDDPVGSSQRKLAEALDRLRVACPHIKRSADADGWNVVWARDFHQIQAWVENTTNSKGL